VRRWIVLLVFALVVGAALAFSLTQDVRYAATSQVLISRTNLGNVLTGTQDPTSQEFDFNRIIQTQANLARIPRVARRVLDAAGFPRRSEDAFLEQSSVATDPSTDILTMRVEDGDRNAATRLASAYAREFVAYKQTQTVNRLIALRTDLENELKTLPESSAQAVQDREQLQRLRNLIALGDSSIAVVQTARTAEQTQPKTARNVILGILLGLVLGIGVAFLVDALDTRMRRARDVEERLGLPLLGRLAAPPRELRREDGLATLLEPNGSDAEAFRVLRTSLQFAEIDHQARSIIVSSAVESEGKSTTVANLAVAMARSGQRVILADFDFRRPYIERFFGLEREPGATGIVLGTATADEALVDVDIGAVAADGVPGFRGAAPNGRAAESSTAPRARLQVLPTGVLPPNVGEFVTSGAVRNLVTMLTQRCDVLLIDAPPLLQVGDAMALTPHVEAILLVARLGVVRRQMVDEVRRLVETSPASALGVVVTDAGVEPGRGYGYGYYYYAYGDEPSSSKQPKPPKAPEKTAS
jgi:Mrp family chromosome partitioning ATPase/capsular polysaccharide biosynthesis protein